MRKPDVNRPQQLSIYAPIPPFSKSKGFMVYGFIVPESMLIKIGRWVKKDRRLNPDSAKELALGFLLVKSNLLKHAFRCTTVLTPDGKQEKCIYFAQNTSKQGMVLPRPEHINMLKKRLHLTKNDSAGWFFTA